MPPDFPPIDNIGGIRVFRGDGIEGGTKRLILRRMLETLPETVFSYAGTVFGHGALALALACRDVGKTAHLYINAPTEGHPMLDRLSRTGMPLSVHSGRTNADLHRHAIEEARGRTLTPAFDMPIFYETAISAFRGLDLTGVDRIWTAAVSGTLTRALQDAFRDKAFSTVKVAKADCDLGRSEIYTAPEKYHRPASLPPPYPACAYTDAKLWRFASARPAPGTLLWNTAG